MASREAIHTYGHTYMHIQPSGEHVGMACEHAEGLGLKVWIRENFLTWEYSSITQDPISCQEYLELVLIVSWVGSLKLTLKQMR